ncbi:hypothetical protein BXZ70DRAFT_1012858 [Cristinia sonorae]|uniref:Uncharacterized protein n=1 Tax=Cristinia sonorae TaxID=1940300 RepID=A0A8K0UDB9_9AGAR|nr:hypothetical protein BXZ70DRAFT_1012858 [Cristinia sonorae]
MADPTEFYFLNRIKPAPHLWAFVLQSGGLALDDELPAPSVLGSNPIAPSDKGKGVYIPQPAQPLHTAPSGSALAAPTQTDAARGDARGPVVDPVPKFRPRPLQPGSSSTPEWALEPPATDVTLNKPATSPFPGATQDIQHKTPTAAAVTLQSLLAAPSMQQSGLHIPSQNSTAAITAPAPTIQRKGVVSEAEARRLIGQSSLASGSRRKAVQVAPAPPHHPPVHAPGVAPATAHAHGPSAASRPPTGKQMQPRATPTSKQAPPQPGPDAPTLAHANPITTLSAAPAPGPTLTVPDGAMDSAPSGKPPSSRSRKKRTVDVLEPADESFGRHKRQKRLTPKAMQNKKPSA